MFLMLINGGDTILDAYDRGRINSDVGVLSGVSQAGSRFEQERVIVPCAQLEEN